MSDVMDWAVKLAAVVLWGVTALGAGPAWAGTDDRSPVKPVRLLQDAAAREQMPLDAAHMHEEHIFQLTAEQAESTLEVQLSCPLVGHQPQLWVEHVVNPHRQAFLLSLYAEPVEQPDSESVEIGHFSLFPSDHPGRFLLDVRSLETAACSRIWSGHLRLRLRMDGLHGSLTPPLTVRARIVFPPCGALPSQEPQDSSRNLKTPQAP